MNYPDDTQRLAVMGATGSGKTQAALWHLSYRRFDQIPWTIYNFKSDASIDDIPGARDLDVDEVAVRPGVYIQHPHPDQQEEVEDQMWEVWDRGHHGILVDEGYMIGPNNRAFRALLTQGRSRHIPLIILSQRPVWMDRFVFSESEFYQVFRLQHADDIKNVERFVPAQLKRRLPAYHSYYYDVSRDRVDVLRPAPSIDTIHETFYKRLSTLRRVV